MTLQQQLDLIKTINHLIDQSQDEAALGLSLTSELARATHADLAMLSLLDLETPDYFHPRALVDRHEILAQLKEDELGQILNRVLAAPPNEVIHFDTYGKDRSIYWGGLPLWREQKPAGAILLARVKEFTSQQLVLLEITSGQINQALEYFHLASHLKQETLALQTVLKVDRIRDTSSNLDELLDYSLAEVCRVIPAAVGFVMLYDTAGQRLELRAATDHDFISLAGTLEKIYAAADEAIHTALVVNKIYPEGALHALLGVPLILNNRIIGVLGVINSTRQDHFTAADHQLLYAISSQMDTAIFERLEIQRLRETFERSVGPRVMERLLRIDGRDLLKGDRVEITSLFSDIRGFTAFSEHLDPTILQQIINSHLDNMVQVILHNEGTLDKFMGDGLMAIFNAPERQKDHVFRAVKSGLEMQQAHQRIIEHWRERQYDLPPIGIGIATGEAIVGNYGSAEHAEYSAIGASVNLASRLCSAAEAGQVFINDRAYQLIRDRVIANHLTPKALKGFSQPVDVWEVIRLK